MSILEQRRKGKDLTDCFIPVRLCASACMSADVTNMSAVKLSAAAEASSDCDESIVEGIL